jgi:hypothetical protein
VSASVAQSAVSQNVFKTENQPLTEEEGEDEDFEEIEEVELVGSTGVVSATENNNMDNNNNIKPTVSSSASSSQVSPTSDDEKSESSEDIESSPRGAISTEEEAKNVESNKSDLDPSFDPNRGTAAQEEASIVTSVSMSTSVAMSVQTDDNNNNNKDSTGHFLGLEAPPAGIAGPLQVIIGDSRELWENRD